MRVTVKMFAMLRDAAGTGEAAIDLPPESTASDAIDVITALFPAILPYSKRLAAAVNLQYVPMSHPLHDGDELALIPPVSGG